MFTVPEKYRIGVGSMASDASYSNNGAFHVSHWKPGEMPFTVIASDGLGWEHVSVSLPLRCPTWEEMCYIKATFWDEDDAVVQYHPPQKDYVNCHPHCLHLWRQPNIMFPIPPWQLVGPKEQEANHAE